MSTYDQILKKDEISMYVCGPTVYDYLHIGNIRPIIVFDSYRKGLEYIGKKVNYVSNITDIDDKIINKANENNQLASEVSEFYSQKYLDLLNQLNVGEIKIIKVTDLIDDMVEFIDELITKDYAYILEDGIYLDVTKYEEYGKVSKKDIDNLQAGIRIEQGNKKSPLDFVLWKFSNDNNSFESKLGKGRPGWHTECVVIINKVIGAQVDIHAGGQDLSFPHHENENIQNVYANDIELAKLWIHNGFVNIDNQKMSKSLGNVINGQELIDKYGTNLVRWIYLSTTFTKPINIADEIFENGQKELDKVKKAYYLYSKLALEENTKQKDQETVDAIKAIIQRDNSTVKLEQLVLDFVKLTNGNTENKKIVEVGNAIKDVLDILGLNFPEIYTPEVLEKLAKYDELRDAKEFESADELRDGLEKNNIVINITRKGTTAVPK